MSDIPLIPVNTAEAVIARTNKWPVYSVTTTTTHEYADPNYTKVNNGPTPPPVPIPVPTPPPVAYPSGQGPALAPAGYTRALFEDFLTVGIDYTVFGEPAYNGTPGGTHGNFLTSHAEQPGDSLLHLKYYSDPAANNPANFKRPKRSSGPLVRSTRSALVLLIHAQA
jgi:hypothetical protein